MGVNMTKIMLVEDDKSLREIYGVRLLAEGYEITSAGNGEEALAMAVKEKPDLILSDVMMPKISGFDMLDILRSTPETKNIKVIMMTALSSEDQRARGEKLGANRYLVKSQVGIEDVVRTVHDVLADVPNAASPTDQRFGVTAPTAVINKQTIPIASPDVPVETKPVEPTTPVILSFITPEDPVIPAEPTTPPVMATEEPVLTPVIPSETMTPPTMAPEEPVIPSETMTPPVMATEEPVIPSETMTPPTMAPEEPFVFPITPAEPITPPTITPEEPFIPAEPTTPPVMATEDPVLTPVIPSETMTPPTMAPEEPFIPPVIKTHEETVIEPITPTITETQLPQPTAPFSTPAPALFGSQIIEPTTPPADDLDEDPKPEPDMETLITEELRDGSDTNPQK
jgi:DNA-binding response OmpR family regulator